MAVSIARTAARGGWLLVLLVAVAVSSCTSNSAPITCPDGQTSCASGCKDIRTDPANCGGCGYVCYVGAGCSNGSCGCPSDKPDTCFNQCVNKASDPANCGTCGHDCGLGSCSSATCQCDPLPVQLCNGTCIDTSKSASNCGSCGHACFPGEVCTASTCVCNPPKQTCGTGSATVCTDTSTDPKNCGGCGNVCATGFACTNGRCTLACQTGQTLCNDVCVDLQTDPANCGVCGRTCSTGQVCSAGTCQAACLNLQCGGSCCSAPRQGNSCCPAPGGNLCPNVHANFPGTANEQVYYDCTPTGTYTETTARTAAAQWGPNGRFVQSQTCPSSGGSSCVQWQRSGPLGGQPECGVFCWFGALEGMATVTSSTLCVCPTPPRVPENSWN